MEKQLSIMLADDNDADRFLFEKALDKSILPLELIMIEDGEKLMNYLAENTNNLPDIIFLDMNIPYKNGIECLTEIKANKITKDIPVIIYSSSLEDTHMNTLYEKGAYYYMEKESYSDLVKNLKHILLLLKEKKFYRPLRDEFFFRLKKT
jgi:CheY-like chemotaxis protein